MGQILPGVPVWSMAKGSRWPDLPLVVFPGNVGGKQALSEAMIKVRKPCDPCSVASVWRRLARLMPGVVAALCSRQQHALLKRVAVADLFYVPTRCWSCLLVPMVSIGQHQVLRCVS